MSHQTFGNALHIIPLGWRLGLLFLFIEPALVIDRGYSPKISVDNWDDEQCGNGGEHQTADYGASKWRILLTAFAQPESHGKHADNHGGRGHQHGPDPGKAGGK